MPFFNLPLCDRHKTGQARLAGEHVVAAADTVPLSVDGDSQQMRVLIVQRAEIGGNGETLHPSGELPVPFFSDELGGGEQRGAQVAAVDRGDNRRAHHAQRFRIVPVIEVAAVFLHAFHGADDPQKALFRFLPREKAELLRPQNGEQGEADVGRARPVGDRPAGLRLIVVRRQKIVCLRHHLIEKPPDSAGVFS